MKKSLNIQINFTNRVIYTFIAFTIFILAGVAVFAFGTSSPSTFGHSAAELDLSGGVQGDAVFLGNVNVSGNMKTNGNMDVVGAIKIGSAATCNTNTEGTLRYNSVDKNMEVCNSTKWKGMVGQQPSLPSAPSYIWGTSLADGWGGPISVGSNSGSYPVHTFYRTDAGLGNVNFIEMWCMLSSGSTTTTAGTNFKIYDSSDALIFEPTLFQRGFNTRYICYAGGTQYGGGYSWSAIQRDNIPSNWDHIEIMAQGRSLAEGTARVNFLI